MAAPRPGRAGSAGPPEPAAAEVFKALSDPIRWDIVCQMAAVDELACSVLEETLPVSKPTISYHTKILVQAGLVAVRKDGRNLYYVLRRDALRQLVAEIWQIAPEPVPVRAGRIAFVPSSSPRRRSAVTNRELRRGRDTASRQDPSHDQDITLLTW
jgi:DNA-binding transcriptional ArsR family regulator